MTNKEIKEYMNLCIIGKESIPKRKKILDKKLLEFENEISKLQESINFINYKTNFMMVYYQVKLHILVI